MVATLDQWHQVQLELQKKVANSFENFRSKGEQNKTRGQTQVRLEALEKHVAQFQKNHAAILKLPNVDKDHLYFKTNLFELVEDSYYQSKGDNANFIMELDKKEKLEAPPAPLTQDQNRRD